jgi:hypothetical protein
MLSDKSRETKTARLGSIQLFDDFWGKLSSLPSLAFQDEAGWKAFPKKAACPGELNDYLREHG